MFHLVNMLSVNACHSLFSSDKIPISYYYVENMPADHDHIIYFPRNKWILMKLGVRMLT